MIRLLLSFHRLPNLQRYRFWPAWLLVAVKTTQVDGATRMASFVIAEFNAN